MATNHLKPGALIDRRFQIGRQLGAGGYGEVYEAYQLSMQRTVVLKVLRPHLARKQKIVERFQNEARYACRLTHPNTVVYYDFGYDEKNQLLYLAMEHLEGESLSERLKRHGTLSVDETTHILEQVCGSLSEAHSIGLVHRDIKPANIMLVRRAGREDYVKVIDFGIAKATDTYDGESKSLTATGAILGTPHYMAPEQIRGEGILDARADVYSLGCLVYKLLTGLPPFRGLTAIEVATQHLTSPPPRIQSLTQRPLPNHIEPLLRRTLSKEVSARPKTSLNFYQDWCEATAKESETVPPLRPPPATLVPSRRKVSKRQTRELGLVALIGTGAFVVFLSTGLFIAKSYLKTTSPNVPAGEATATAVSPPPRDIVPVKTTPIVPTETEATADADTPLTVEVKKDEVQKDEAAALTEASEEPEEEKKTKKKATTRQTRKRPPKRTEPKTPTPEKTPAAESGSPDADRKVTGGAPEEERAHNPQQAKQPILVTLSVKPWGKVKVGGRTINSPARISLKPGGHTVFYGQRGTPHSRRINVTPEIKFFQFRIPEQK